MREIARMGHDVVIITSDANQLAMVPQMSEPNLFEHVHAHSPTGSENTWYSAYQSRKSHPLQR